MQKIKPKERKIVIESKIAIGEYEKTIQGWFARAGKVEGRKKDNFIIGWLYTYPTMVLAEGEEHMLCGQEKIWGKWSLDFHKKADELS